MAYNNSGYPYQYQNPSGWTPNYGQQPSQRAPEGQAPARYQQMPQQAATEQQQQQQQQLQAQQYRLPSHQSYMNSPQSPQQVPMPQQYQYRVMPSPELQYSPRIPQFDGGGSSYGQAGQDYSSPQQQYQSWTPQQQYNQYAMAQNQRISSLPQRQLSYAQPQHYQMSSPQTSHGAVPPSPQFTQQSYSAQAQPVFDRQTSNVPMTYSPVARQVPSQSPVVQLQKRSSIQQISGQQMQDQSPVLQTQKKPSFAKLDQVPLVRQIQSQSPVVQSRQSPSTTMPDQRPASGHTTQQPSAPRQYASAPKQIPAARTSANQPIQTKATDQHAQDSRSASSSLISQHQKPPPHQPAPSQNTSQSSPMLQTMKVKRSSNSPQIKSQSINRVPPSVPLQPMANNVQTSTAPAQQSISVSKEFPKVKTEPILDSSRSAPKVTAQPQPISVSTKKQETKPVIKSEPAEEISKPVTEIDYALLLIDLAEEYFGAAYGVSKDGRSAKREKNLRVFYKLIATGLGCLEVVLKQWRSTLQPAVEAAVRLRYASILFAETTNTSEAEEVLSRGISQCDKLRLLNFKYNMHHLLARVTFTTNPKAALKYVASVIKDAEVQNHIPWIYAFRFLSASLSLQMKQPQDTLQALNQLRAILSTAKSRGDIAVAATASAIEAMTHINRANNSEAIEHAQTSLATVRSAENNPNVPKIPQLIIMAYFVDLTCSLFKADSENANRKTKAMHVSMDELADHPGWTDDDQMLIPISEQSAKSMPGDSAQGVVLSQQGEQIYLKMAWMPKNELYALGNMLGAATSLHKASSDKKCEGFLENAKVYLRLAETADQSVSNSKIEEDLSCHLQILKVFASCSKNAWGDAKKELNSLKVKMAGMDDAAKVSLPAFIIYLEAMIAQGTGDTSTALVLYSNPMLAPAKDGTTRRSPIINDLSTLAVLNSILIIHRPNHPQHHRMESLITTLDALDTTNPSGNMRGAYYLIRALRSDSSTDPSTNPILNTKSNLRELLQIAKQTSNSQFSCISLTFMTDRFFKGQVGDQAHKSATTALNLARRGKNDLWTSVAEGLLAACLETRGDSAEADMRRREALQLAMKLPASMQIADDDDDNNGGNVGRNGSAF